MAEFWRRLVREFWGDRRGQDLIEYTLLLAFLSLAVAGIALGLGASTSGIWGATSTTLTSANQTASGSTPTTAPANGDGGQQQAH